MRFFGLVLTKKNILISISFFIFVVVYTRVVAKTVVMVCTTGTISGQQSTAAYGRWMIGEGDSHCM